MTEQSDETKAPNIYQRINKVRDAVKYLQKDAKVQGYKGVTHDAVTAACREHLTTHGILIVPEQISSDWVHVGETEKGSPIIRYSGWYKVQFVNIDDPDQRISVTVESHANDHGDKAPGKALSYSVKAAMLKLFSIETGENEESRVEVAKGLEPISEEQAKVIEDLIEQSGADVTQFLKWLKVTKVADIKAQAFDDVVKALKAKKAKNEKEVRGEGEPA